MAKKTNKSETKNGKESKKVDNNETVKQEEISSDEERDDDADKDIDDEESDGGESDDEEIEDDEGNDEEYPIQKRRREKKSQDEKQKELFGCLWENIDVPRSHNFNLLFNADKDGNGVGSHTIVVGGMRMRFSAKISSGGVKGHLEAFRPIHGYIAARFRVDTGKETVTEYSTIRIKFAESAVYWSLSSKVKSLVRMEMSCKYVTSFTQATMSFNEEHNPLADGILQLFNAQTFRFHVIRTELIAKSVEFEKLFRGKKREEPVMVQGNARDFHIFLEAIHGRDVISDSYVKAVAEFASKYKVKSVLKKCEIFLLEKSKLNLVEKFDLGKKHDMKKLKEYCIDRMNNLDDDDVLKELSSFKDDKYVPDEVKQLISKACSLNAKRAKK